MRDDAQLSSGDQAMADDNGDDGSGSSAKALASIFSVAGLGFGAFSEVLKGQGTQAADEYRAATLENAAARGRAAAVETGAQYSNKLASQLANIDAIRAAAHADPTSPTGAAVRDWTEELGNTKKAIDVDNIIAQSQQEESDAAYLRKAGKAALMSGYLGAGSDILKGIGQAAPTLLPLLLA
jgi:hypothetical protein